MKKFQKSEQSQRYNQKFLKPFNFQWVFLYLSPSKVVCQYWADVVPLLNFKTFYICAFFGQLISSGRLMCDRNLGRCLIRRMQKLDKKVGAYPKWRICPGRIQSRQAWLLCAGRCNFRAFIPSFVSGPRSHTTPTEKEKVHSSSCTETTRAAERESFWKSRLCYLAVRIPQLSSFFSLWITLRTYFIFFPRGLTGLGIPCLLPTILAINFLVLRNTNIILLGPLIQKAHLSEMWNTLQ